MNRNITLPFKNPTIDGWMEAYERKLPMGVKAAGWFIQSYFRERGIEYPQYRWIQLELSCPAFQHLSFAYKGNIYSVLFEFVNHDGNYVREQDIENQLRECQENDLVACTLPMDYETYEPLVGGTHLILTLTREPVVFSSRQGNIPMSPWEINNFGIDIVKSHLKGDGQTILSFCDVLGVEPNIWFEDELGRRSYVIVKTISGNTPEAVDYRLNQQLLLRLLKYEGYFAEVYAYPSDAIVYDREGNEVPQSQRGSRTNPKEILFRDHVFDVDFEGLKLIERKAAGNGVVDKPIFMIREE